MASAFLFVVKVPVEPDSKIDDSDSDDSEEDADAVGETSKSLDDRSADDTEVEQPEEDGSQQDKAERASIPSSGISVSENDRTNQPVSEENELPAEKLDLKEKPTLLAKEDNAESNSAQENSEKPQEPPNTSDIDDDPPQLPASPPPATLSKSASSDQSLDKELEIVPSSSSTNLQVRNDAERRVSSASMEPTSKIDEDDTVPFVPQKSLLKRVIEKVESFGIESLSYQKSSNSKYFQIIFEVDGGNKCEELLNILADLGIGDRPQTSLSLYPASIFRGPKDNQGEKEEDTEELQQIPSDSQENVSKASDFKKSIKARMLVTEVVNTVQGNAAFTFDYLLLIILASLISAMGLVENSSVVLVASMLVSPIMGPILAGVFGLVIRNNHLRNLGIKSEVKGLLICVIMAKLLIMNKKGFLFGFITGGVNLDGANWGSSDDWPTTEMKSRGKLRSLWVGVLIALPSGAGVALSVLGGNIGSLVGVAISASLLPPAVNAGMLWSYAIIAAISPPVTILKPVADIANITNTTQLDIKPVGLNCARFVGNTYEPVYSCDMASEMALLGLVSLTLTLVNIICIFFMGICVLKLKEVAPQTAVSNTDKKFWGEDIQIARTYYTTAAVTRDNTLAVEARNLLNEWRIKNGEEPIQTLAMRRLMEEVDNDPSVQDLQKFIPGQNAGRKLFTSQLEAEFQRAKDHMGLSLSETDVRSPSSPVAYRTYHGVSALSLRRRWNPPSPDKHGASSDTNVTSEMINEMEQGKKIQPLTDGSSPKRTHFSSVISKPFAKLKHPSKSSLGNKRIAKNKPKKTTRFAVEKVGEDEQSALLAQPVIQPQDETTPKESESTSSV